MPFEILSILLKNSYKDFSIASWNYKSTIWKIIMNLIDLNHEHVKRTADNGYNTINLSIALRLLMIYIMNAKWLWEWKNSLIYFIFISFIYFFFCFRIEPDFLIQVGKYIEHGLVMATRFHCRRSLSAPSPRHNQLKMPMQPFLCDRTKMASTIP